MASKISSEKDSSRDVAAYKRLTNDVFVHGSVSLALAVAQETGMIKVLCQAEGPLTSAHVARQAKLKERYVREVLNALAVAGLVQLETGTGGKDGLDAQYTVPQTHRCELTKVGVYSLLLSATARSFAEVRKCFDQDGPNCVRYNATVHDVLETLGALGVENAIAVILKTPGLKERLEDGIEAAEVGCGAGILGCRLAAMFPNTRFTLTDVSPEALERTRKRVQEAGLTNVTVHLLDVCQVPDDWKEKFDWMMARDVIHDLPYPLKALQGINKVLKSGGHFSLFDQFVSTYVAENLANDEVASLYALSTFFCIPESYQQPDSEALGACWGEEKARELLNTSGFKVLGLTRSETEDMGAMAVCMCQKPKQTL